MIWYISRFGIFGIFFENIEMKSSPNTVILHEVEPIRYFGFIFHNIMVVNKIS